MILVIFGAGASYDSVPSKPASLTKLWGRQSLPNRPPLANDLFSDIEVVKDALKRFPECYPIVPYLQDIPANQTIENVLENLQSESEMDVVRKRQLAAVRYYLHLVIRDFEQRWLSVHNGITNFVTLLDQVRRAHRTEEPVCIVTFNYDCMIEDALRRSLDISITSMSHFIENPEYKLFKLHGSVNWGKKIKAPFDRVEQGRSVWDLIKELIREADKLELSSDFELVNEFPIAKLNVVPLFPAIAIPVVTKREYECPDEHLRCLKDLLPQTRTILSIGWRGMEKHFLKMLAESLAGKPPIPACAVAGSAPGAKQVLIQLQDAGLSIKGRRYKMGFTEFVKDRLAERFCTTNGQALIQDEENLDADS
jgi:SIR2-like domain